MGSDTGSVGISSADSRRMALNIATSNLATHCSIINLAGTGKQPHSCPPARTGQSLSQASLKAFFQSSNEKFTWSSSHELDTLPRLFLDPEPTKSSIAFVAADCMCGVRVCHQMDSTVRQKIQASTLSRTDINVHGFSQSPTSP
uniref:Uncharacterized protein n=1 Tax=Rhizophora mucronata TaxID=61149 RepID=A0A2P2K3V3_RHIMU